jgi:peroxiredoxin Q/BCP
MPKLTTGDQAPPFELKDQEGHTVRLADFQGRKLLLYFYPKADTPGCTKQACSVRDGREDLSIMGLAVVAISPDDIVRQKKFDTKYGLGFPLLSDSDNAVAEAYGVWGEKSMYGKKVKGIIRSSFLIDESGKISQAWYRVKPEETVPNAKLVLNIKG